ncbi:MAG: 4-hydroxy-tetrahydrodipicolinate reductase [Deltaproteobacteria bacterium]|nr:4-hydroxy-tetrahydrodipicolinate reductase [Deltaproteobacteria bacterium]
MKISIIGFGQMGQMLLKSARERQVEVVSIVDPFHPEATHKEICGEAMDQADVLIAFTQPDAAIKNIQDACLWKKNLVMATTGWTDQMEAVKDMVEKNAIGMVYSSNFSIGVNIFFKLIEKSARIIDAFSDYDILAFEAHHNKKRDSPSGTAKTMQDILLKELKRKNSICEDKLDRKIAPDEIHFASLRGGHIPGTHAVCYDSPFDTIELKHTARTREGFASGSILAAEWIKDKKGLFTEKDMMDQILSSAGI